MTCFARVRTHLLSRATGYHGRERRHTDHGHGKMCGSLHSERFPRRVAQTISSSANEPKSQTLSTGAFRGEAIFAAGTQKFSIRKKVKAETIKKRRLTGYTRTEWSAKRKEKRRKIAESLDNRPPAKAAFFFFDVPLLIRRRLRSGPANNGQCFLSL